MDARTMSESSIFGVADFDFLVGDWRVRHRRLRHRLVGCEQWDAFEGTANHRQQLGGQGNIEEHVLALPEGTGHALAIRAFDPSTALWSIWWLDARAPDRIGPPIVGRFDAGIGLFFGEDIHESVDEGIRMRTPVRVRFTWRLPHDAEPPRWEQAFSADGGRTWETNWMMEFVRTAA
jgi:hypothetical protein